MRISKCLKLNESNIGEVIGGGRGKQSVVGEANNWCDRHMQYHSKSRAYSQPNALQFFLNLFILSTSGRTHLNESNWKKIQ